MAKAKKSAGGKRTLKGDVIHRGKMYLKGKHDPADLPEDFPDEDTLNDKIDKAGRTEGLKVSNRSATAANEAADEGLELNDDEEDPAYEAGGGEPTDDELDDALEGEEEGEGEGEDEAEAEEEDAEEDKAPGKGKTGNAAGKKGNSGKDRTKPQGGGAAKKKSTRK